jgi:hypothetical protein
MLNVNKEHIQVVFRASRFLLEPISAAHICVLLGTCRYKVLFELSPFPSVTQTTKVSALRAASRVLHKM